jgi:hypothetical protein
MNRYPKTTLLLLLLILVIFLWGAYSLIVNAETNIDATDHWAWSDTAGWWDFYSTGNVEVSAPLLHGYASSSIGEMSLNCNATPNGNICGDSDFKVTNVDASGQLSGCAWNDTIGWISFDCADYDCNGGNICAESDYQVTIDANGDFQDYAWNDIEGWISFNCANDASCASSNYKVTTSWRAGKTIGYLTSSIIDTGGDVTLSNIIWQGAQPAGASVDFQIAVATNTAGPWNYKGPSGTDETYFGNECPTAGVGSAGPNKAICVDKTITANKRYLRYKVRLQSNTAQTQTPVIEDIILNWAR